MLPSEIGAVVLGVPRTCHTPLSGQDWPVLAVVSKGTLVFVLILLTGFFTRCLSSPHSTGDQGQLLSPSLAPKKNRSNP